MNNPEHTVAPTIDVRFWRRLVKLRVMEASIPVPIIAAPNIIAESTSATVDIIPEIPLVDTRLSSRSMPVSMAFPDQSICAAERAE